MKFKTFRNKLPIYTDRFKIQILGSRDVDEYMKEIRKPYFTEYIDNKSICKLSDFEVASRLRALVQYYNSNEIIKYEIRLTIKNLDNKMLGGITINPHINSDEIEIGYWVKPEYQNNGIATEILNRVMEFASAVFKNIDTAVLIIQERNIASLKVAKKCKFTPVEYIPGLSGRNVKCIRKLRTN